MKNLLIVFIISICVLLILIVGTIIAYRYAIRLMGRIEKKLMFRLLYKNPVKYLLKSEILLNRARKRLNTNKNSNKMKIILMESLLNKASGLLINGSLDEAYEVLLESKGYIEFLKTKLPRSFPRQIELFCLDKIINVLIILEKFDDAKLELIKFEELLDKDSDTFDINRYAVMYKDDYAILAIMSGDQAFGHRIINESLEACTKFTYREATLYYYLGISFYKNGNYANAIKNLDNALSYCQNTYLKEKIIVLRKKID